MIEQIVNTLMKQYEGKRFDDKWMEQIRAKLISQIKVRREYDGANI